MQSQQKLNKLSELLKAADIKTEFDIVGDLEQLQRLFGVLKAKDYRKHLAALVDKYKNTEITVIREALLDRCRKGDTGAIRLYCDYFKSSDVEEAGDDGLIEALLARGNEVFKDED